MFAALLLSLAMFAEQPKSPAQTAREIVDALLAQQFSAVASHFTPEMKQALDEEKLRQATSQLSQFGSVKEILAPEVQKSGEMTIAIVPVVFEKLAINIQLAFNQSGQVAGLFFRPRTEPSAAWTPPSYSKASTFRAEQVTVGTGEWQLPGTLLIPSGKGPFPALVLVHGSGPNDQDESVGGVKVFRDLAEGLASNGIAVLRYEKRTRQHAAKFAAVKTFTINDETVDDALGAAALLRTRTDVNPKRVYVLGHSLGGYAGPRIGKRDPKLAGLIIMAGNTRPIEDLVLEQTEYIGSLQKNPEAEKQLGQLREMAKRIKDVKTGEPVPPLLGAPAEYWLDLKDYRPAEMARSLKLPLLILQGERDYQVTMTDFAGWKKALGSLPNATFQSYPALNHLFIEGEGKSTPAEYRRPGHVSAALIDDIARWILK
ncbi:MAG TPA: alpha/beta fold hydrolase [Bryobacteraceae bacterium]|nr:alpha/beta fold hydrolase [Bryobacteraceae bacterium]